MNVVIALLLSLVGLCAMRYLLERVEENILAQTSGMLSRYDHRSVLEPIFRQVHAVRQLVQEPALLMWAKDVSNLPMQQRVSELLRRFHTGAGDSRMHVVLDTHLLKTTLKTWPQNVSFHNASLIPMQRSEAPALWAENESDVSVHILRGVALLPPTLRIRSLIVADGQTLGFVDTQMNLRKLSTLVTAEPVNGITTLLVDEEGHTLLMKPFQQAQERGEATLDALSLILSPQLGSEPLRQIKRAMQQQRRGQEPASLLLQYEHPASAVALRYIPELDWHELNVLNVRDLPVLAAFQNLYWIMLVAIWGSCLLVCLFGDWLVMCPLSRMYSAMRDFGDNPIRSQPLRFVGKPPLEIGSMMTMIETYTQAIANIGTEVEHQVAERTSMLAQLATSDPLTLLLNQRGMESELRSELARARREQRTFGLLWVEVCHYYRLQTSLGRQAGESILRHVAKSIQLTIREYDSACHWGENEFLILVHSDGVQSLRTLAARLCRQCEVPLCLGL